MITLTIAIPIPPATPLGVAGRVFTVADELVAELNALDGICAAWTMHVGAADVTAAPLPAVAAAFSPNGHAPQPEPAPVPYNHAPEPEPAPVADRAAAERAQLLADVCDEQRRLSKNGVAPSQTHWNDARRPGLTSAVAITHRLGITWENLCAAAGLRTKRSVVLAGMADARRVRAARRPAPEAAGVRVAAVDDDDGEEDAAGDDAGF